MTTQLNEQARTINAFGTRLLSLLDRGDASSSSNLFLSPPSIVAALSLALAAAEPGSECEKQLREALAPSSCASAEEALASVAALLSSAVASSSASASSSSSPSSSPASSPIVEAANSVWCAGGYEFSEDYLSRLEPFKAEARSLSEGGAKAINSWVSAKTRGKISAIIDETTAAAATAILVNALYFKGRWRQKFDPRASGPGDFEVVSKEEEKKKIKAHFMNKTFKRGSSGVKVFKKAGAVSLAVKLPYASSSSSSSSSSTDDEDAGGGESGGEKDLFEAVFALPEPGVPFADALAALQEEEEREEGEGDGGGGGGGEGGEGKWTDPPRAGVEVSVPAFKAEGACLRLAPLLRAPPSSSSSSSPCSGGLGLSAPFCQATCEFTRMFAGGREAPAIEEVLHKVTVECDEHGSEAAAATAVVMMRAMLAVEEPLRFSADRPFLFCVRHVASGLDLFAGRVAAPRSWEGKEGEGKADGGDGEPGCSPGAAPVCD